MKKHAKLGRPSHGDVPSVLGYYVKGALYEGDWLEFYGEHQGCFILATNNLKGTQTAKELYRLYQKQAGIGGGFAYWQTENLTSESLLRTTRRLQALWGITALSIALYGFLN
jgi:hypothetical protein